jgi:hypothetical protein
MDAVEQCKTYQLKDCKYNSIKKARICEPFLCYFKILPG